MKTIKTIAFSTAILLACSSFALADGNAFTPLNFDDASYSGAVPEKVETVPATVKNTSTPVTQKDMVGNSGMQNAILELDNAQVDVRNDLLNYKAKYTDVDNQYKLIKAERKALKKQVNSIERRIKQIDKTKEKIRKNML